MTAPEYTTCPCGCGQRQDAGLLADSCTTRLEGLLREVPSLVTELAVTVSKQARIGAGGGSGLARERSPLHFGAVEVADNLANVLTTWARDVSNSAGWVWVGGPLVPANQAAGGLLALIDHIRRHPAVNELTDEIADAINQARKAIDRPQDKRFLGDCMTEFPDPEGRLVTYTAEVWAREGATETKCRECGITHDVKERRAWLLLQAEDQLVTAQEASRYIGEVGGIPVGLSRIRNYVQRGKLALRPSADGAKRFRLGDLLEMLVEVPISGVA